MLLFRPIEAWVGIPYLLSVGFLAYGAYTIGGVAHQAWGAHLAREPAALSRLMAQREIGVIVGILGAFFLLQGINWLVSPGAAAEALGMPLLDGAARSTQVGDLAGFFLCLGGMAIYGAYRSAPTWIRASGCLVGIVAITRTIAWLFHDADFTTLFIAVEVIAGATLLFLARKIEESTRAD